MANPRTMAGDIASLKSATKVFTITPHDSNQLDEPTRAIHANTDGVVVGIFADDTEVCDPLTVVAGMEYPWQLKLVHTDTTATIMGLL